MTSIVLWYIPERRCCFVRIWKRREGIGWSTYGAVCHTLITTYDRQRMTLLIHGIPLVKYHSSRSRSSQGQVAPSSGISFWPILSFSLAGYRMSTTHAHTRISGSPRQGQDRIRGTAESGEREREREREALLEGVVFFMLSSPPLIFLIWTLLIAFLVIGLGGNGCCFAK